MIIELLALLVMLSVSAGCVPSNPPPPRPLPPAPGTAAPADPHGGYWSPPPARPTTPGQPAEPHGEYAEDEYPTQDYPERDHRADEYPVDPYRSDAEPAPSSAPGRAPPVQPGQPAQSRPAGRLAGILAAHNRHRAQHCAPPLVWSEAVAAAAQRWANTLRDNQCAFEHDTNSPYGENLAYFAPLGSSRAERVEAGWYDEVRSYDFSRPGFAFKTGHFTQIVWLGTTELGCAMAECRNAELWVCRYNPPGNVRGQYRTNVLPTSCRD
ncbi:MAG: CAP domain-containing protein [Proteobacteria bacterium]|nr:CAP domain-containing protein [Pseudomonadota bacterium]